MTEMPYLTIFNKLKYFNMQTFGVGLLLKTLTTHLLGLFINRWIVIYTTMYSTYNTN